MTKDLAICKYGNEGPLTPGVDYYYTEDFMDEVNKELIKMRTAQLAVA